MAIMRSRRNGRVSFRKIAQTITLCPNRRIRGRVALEPAEALARDWETVMGDAAVVMGDLRRTWVIFERDMNARVTRAQQSEASRT